MKQLLQQYALYNIWANKLITERIAQLPEEAIVKETVSSFNSLYKTVLHMMDVESIWWQRMKLQEHVEWPGKKFEGNFDQLAQQLLSLSRQWHDWIQNTNDANLTHVFSYQNSKKEHFKQPVYEMLLQLFNHQTFHRGQLVTMLRQNGIEKIPATDFIIFSRTRAGNSLKAMKN
ncbi:MAG: DinB family protein [Ginsengibacter sp.]